MLKSSAGAPASWGRPRVPRTISTGRGIGAEAAGDNRAQRAASHHVAIAQARIAEAGRAVAFGRRQPLLVRVETRRDGRDLAPPELGVRFGGRKDLDTGRCAFGIAARPVLL
jgi:hypothetical protein